MRCTTPSSARTVDQLVAIGSNGRVYSVPVAQLPSARGDGAPVTSMIELAAGTRLIGYVAGPSSQPLLLATSKGYGFACELGDLVTRQKGGKQFHRRRRLGRAAAAVASGCRQ